MPIYLMPTQIGPTNSGLDFFIIYSPLTFNLGVYVDMGCLLVVSVLLLHWKHQGHNNNFNLTKKILETYWKHTQKLRKKEKVKATRWVSVGIENSLEKYVQPQTVRVVKNPIKKDTFVFLQFVWYSNEGCRESFWGFKKKTCNKTHKQDIITLEYISRFIYLEQSFFLQEKQRCLHFK